MPTDIEVEGRWGEGQKATKLLIDEGKYVLINFIVVRCKMQNVEGRIK